MKKRTQKVEDSPKNTPVVFHEVSESQKGWTIGEAFNEKEDLQWCVQNTLKTETHFCEDWLEACSLWNSKIK